MSTSVEDEQERRIDRALLGLLAAALVGWALVFLGPTSVLVPLGSDSLQFLASAVAALVVRHGVRRGRSPLGRGGPTMAVAAAIWCLTDVTWLVVSRVADGGVEWTNLGYGAATLAFALGAFRSAEFDRVADGWTTALRTVTDVLLVAFSVGGIWLVSAWNASDAGHTSAALVLTGADAAFVCAALFAWTRSPPERRRTGAVLCIAAAVLFICDVAYLRDIFLTDYAAGGLVDLGWFSVLSLITLSARLRPSRTAPDRDVAGWTQLGFAPSLGLGVVLLLALDLAPLGAATAAIAVLVAVLLCLRTGLVVAEHRDLNQRLSAIADALAHRADHDELSGVLRREAFEVHTGRALAATAGHGGRLALAWIDLDGFKSINDAFGHAAGDEVLRDTAARLIRAVDPDDVVGRLGGDEFVVLRPVAGDDVDAWADHLREVISAPHRLGAHRLSVTCSIGVLETDGVGQDVSRVLVDADLAMYRAKATGRNRVARFSPALRPAGVPDAAVQDLLEAALAPGAPADIGLRVEYQPVVDLTTGHPVGAEALARFHHPDLGSLSPDEFLPIADASNLLGRLALGVVTDACGQLERTDDLGWISFNLGSKELADDALVGDLIEAAGRHRQRLVVEINERVVPEPHIVQGAWRLADAGFRVALDDFGTGWSSLAQLRRLPLHAIKIDRSLVVDSARNGGQRDRRSQSTGALIAAVVALGDAMGAGVMAEGVETDDEHREVRRLGVQFGQGFLWSDSVPGHRLGERLTELADGVTSGDRTGR